MVQLQSAGCFTAMKKLAKKKTYTNPFSYGCTNKYFLFLFYASKINNLKTKLTISVYTLSKFSVIYSKPFFVFRI